ncbi:hypothetical protein V6R21_09620 [Limibacter armeniacum]|uniref:hypothetical protein n=1 Tax=Limibacter armeniacum TaxID=466084 RepID=UPI002FE6479B
MLSQTKSDDKKQEISRKETRQTTLIVMEENSRLIRQSMNNANNFYYRGFKIHKGEFHYMVMQIYDMSEHRYEIVSFAHTLREAQKQVDNLIRTKLRKLFFNK